MTVQEATALIAELKAMFPRQELTEETVKGYAKHLIDLDYGEAAAAIAVVVRGSRWFPTVAEIRETVARRHLRLPSAGEAWLQAVEERMAHEAVRRAANVVGGTWNIQTSDNTVAIRAQFMRAYQEIADEMVADEATGVLMVGPGRLEIGS